MERLLDEASDVGPTVQRRVSCCSTIPQGGAKQ
jgi:hypothetical protein